MTTKGSCPNPEALISFLYDEFDAGAIPSRNDVAQHLRLCEACASEVASLGATREHLSAWTAPEPDLGFRVVRQPARRSLWWPEWAMPVFPLAAAAVLVLGAALGLARLDVRYGADGLQVRTGWGREPSATASSPGGVAVQRGSSLAGPTLAGTGRTLTSATATDTGAAARLDSQLAAFREEMRRELDALRRGNGGRGSQAGSGAPAADAAWLERVRNLIDQSEVRQQQNLSLRISELAKDFELRRNADLVHIEQGFGRLSGQRQLDAEQQQMLLNAIRVSQQQPRR